MIIRRRHTANFTTIGNALFEDERLAADEVGVLAFLLSRPHDWEVRRPALMRRWKVGRDAIKRIMTNLIRTGWCQARKTRLSNGTFHIVYEIRDEPGIELSEDEVRGTLSLVSSEVADAESDDGAAPDHLRDTGDPPTGQPHLDDQHTVSRSWPIEDSQNTDSVRTESTQGGCAFACVRATWPPDYVLSIVICESLHAGLTDAEQDSAFQGVKPYLDDCRTKNRKICDLGTYYRERRWERFIGVRKSAAPATMKVHSPQWYRWREYKIAMGQPIKFMDHYASQNPKGLWTEPSEWPPALGASATGPPDPTLTKEDSDIVANL